MPKKAKESKKSDDTLTYVLIGAIILGMGVWYYYYYMEETFYDETSIGGSPETVGVMPPEQKPKPVPKVQWNGIDGSLHKVVIGSNPFASTRRGFTSVQLNASANKNLEECKNACYQADTNTNVVALAPSLAKTRPICQCFKVSSNLKLAPDNSSVSTVAYLSTLTPQDASGSNTNEASKNQKADPITPTDATCKLAPESQSKGYHMYHASDALINGTPVYIWYDTSSKQVNYKRWDIQEDFGILEYGEPPTKFSVPSTVFVPGDKITIDFKLGIVCKKSLSKSFSGQSEDNSRVRINGNWYDWNTINYMSIIRDATTGAATKFDGKTSLVISNTASPRNGKLTGTPDEIIYITHNNKLYCFVNRAAMSSTGTSATPIYPQTTLTQAHGSLSYYNYSKLRVDETHNINGTETPVWLVITMPAGTMSGNKFTPDSKQTMYTFYVKNSATPNKCISCQTREESVCPSNTVLVGCGLKSKGYCSTCYKQSYSKTVDDMPCGNCQVGRLMVHDPSSNKIWTDANKLDLKHIVARESDITKLFTGPFITKQDANSLSGKYSIGDCMTNARCRSRVIKTANATGVDNGKPSYCAHAPGEMQVTTKTMNDWVNRHDFGKFHGFSYVSTLFGKSFGEAICQRGTSVANKLDGGFCTTAYADLDLNNFNYRKGTGNNVFTALSSNGCAHYDSNSSNHKHWFQSMTTSMDLKVKWSHNPRILMPSSGASRVYNDNNAVALFQQGFKIVIYNNLDPEGSVTIDKSKHALFNSGKNEAFSFVNPSDAQAFRKIKLIKLPAYSSITIGEQSNTMVIDNIHPVTRYIFPTLMGLENVTIKRVTKQYSTKHDNDAPKTSQRWNTAVRIKTQNSTCAKEDCVKFEVHSGQVQVARNINTFGMSDSKTYFRCFEAGQKGCPGKHDVNIAWGGPRAVAEARVMGLRVGNNGGSYYNINANHNNGCGPNHNPFSIRNNALSKGETTEAFDRRPDLRIYTGKEIETPADGPAVGHVVEGELYPKERNSGGGGCTVM